MVRIHPNLIVSDKKSSLKIMERLRSSVGRAQQLKTLNNNSEICFLRYVKGGRKEPE